MHALKDKIGRFLIYDIKRMEGSDVPDLEESVASIFKSGI
jgi:hypothetical protein